MGVMGAILFSLICPIDWIIMDSFGIFGGILPVLIPVATFVGFRLFYGRINKKVFPKVQIVVGIVFVVVLLLTWYCFVCKDVLLSINASNAEKGLSPVSYFGVLFDFKIVFSNVNISHFSALIASVIFGFMEFALDIVVFRKLIKRFRKFSQPENAISDQNKLIKRRAKGNFAVGVILSAITSIILSIIWFAVSLITTSGIQIVFCTIIPFLSILFYKLYSRRLVTNISEMPKYIVGEVISSVISFVVVIVTWQSLFSINIFAYFVYWFNNGWVTSVPTIFDCFKPSVRSLYFEICGLTGDSIWILMRVSIWVLISTFFTSWAGLSRTLHEYYCLYIYDVETWGICIKNDELQQKEDDVEEGCDINQQNTEKANSSDVNSIET